MASNGLGTLTLDLVAKIAGFTGPLSAAERDLKKKTDRMNKMAYDLGEGIGRSLKSAAGHFLAFAGVSVSIGAVAASIKGAIDSADKLNDMSIRLGASAEALSGWSYAAKQTGTDIDALGVGFKKLQASMADALDPKSEKGKLFAALGVSVTDANGKLKTLEEIVPQVATAFKGLNDDALQTKVAMDLFGKSGTDLIEFLELGGQGLTDMQTRAQELGIVLSDDTLKAADAFNDGLSDLKSIAEGMANQLAAEMLPTLQDFIDSTLAWWKEGDNAKNVMDALKGSVELLGSALSGIGDVLNSFNGLLGGTSSFAQGAASDIRKLASDMAMFKDIAGGYKDGVIATLQGNEAAQAAAWERIKKAAKTDTRFQDVRGTSVTRQNVIGKDFLDVQGSVTTYSEQEIADRLRRSYGASTGGSRSASRKSSGRSNTPKLSDEAKEAQRLKESYDRLMLSMQERMFMLGKEGEVARVTWDIQHGELAKLSQAQKDAALAAAQAYDLAVAKEQVRKEGEAEAKRKAEQAQREAESRAEFIGSMQEEIKLLGMSNAQQEIYNNLKHLGADATDAEKESVIALTQEIQKMRDMRDLVEGVAGAFGGMFESIMDGSKSAKDAFNDFLADLGKMITRFLMQKAVEQFVTYLLGSMGAGFSMSSGGAGGNFGGGLAKGGVVDQGGLKAFANGGTFTNGLYDTPTLFRYGNGGSFGVMGEAGPEAVMPLSRGPDGKLGVSVQKGMGGNVSVVVENHSGQEAKVQESQGADGERLIRVIVGQAVNEVNKQISGMGGVGKTMASRFGLSPVGATRG